jgi:hypothetical protein
VRRRRGEAAIPFKLTAVRSQSGHRRRYGEAAHAATRWAVPLGAFEASCTLPTLAPAGALAGGVDEGMEPDGVASAGAPQVEKTPKAWALQDEFLETARKLVERVCSRLGVEPPPSLGLIAFPSWKEEEHPPILVRAHGMTWAPTLADWKDEIVAAEKEFDESTSLARWVTRASSRTLAFHKVAAARVAQHDEHGGETRTFVTQAASIWSYDVAAVLEFDEKVFRRFPMLRLPVRGGSTPRDVDVGLLNAVVEAVLANLFEELCKGSSGQRSWVDQRDVDDILRDAGERLMRSVQWTVRDSLFGGNLFERLNAVSSLRYETSELRGGVVFGPKDAAGDCVLTFKEPIQIREAVWTRKTLEMAESSFWAYSDAESLLGLVETEGEPQGFAVRFKGQSRWEVRHTGVVLAEVRLGIPSFPVPRLRRGDFESVFGRVFPDGKQDGVSRIWSLIDAALEQRHGTMIVVAKEAAGEAQRLSRQAILVEPASISPPALFRATAIDGAILLDPDAVCHAVGVISTARRATRGIPRAVPASTPRCGTSTMQKNGSPWWSPRTAMSTSFLAFAEASVVRSSMRCWKPFGPFPTVRSLTKSGPYANG